MQAKGKAPEVLIVAIQQEPAQSGHSMKEAGNHRSESGYRSLGKR